MTPFDQQSASRDGPRQAPGPAADGEAGKTTVLVKKPQAASNLLNKGGRLRQCRGKTEHPPLGSRGAPTYSVKRIKTRGRAKFGFVFEKYFRSEGSGAAPKTDPARDALPPPNFVYPQIQASRFRGSCCFWAVCESNCAAPNLSSPA